MRLEKIAAKVLKKVNNDRYILSLAISERAKRLAEGEEPLINIDKSKYKYTDIALMEMAEDKIEVESIVDKQ
jgi:DNA-directed RNA polymerase subunit omega